VIRWTNLDDAIHNVVSDNDLFTSENLAVGESFEYTATDDSFQTFTYSCTLHAGMFGSFTVVVPEPGAIGATVCLIPLLRRRRRASPQCTSAA
jgi:hypothetical protein